jgi:hypothetical protein
MVRRNSADFDHGLLSHAVAGFAGGLAGSWAMEQLQRALERVVKSDSGAIGGGGQQHRQPQSEPATYKAADAVAETLARQNVPEQYKPVAGALVHYAFGGAVGAMYGAAAATKPDVTAWGGLPFGATVWLIADEMGVPLTGLSKPPTEYPLEDHASAFAAHLVYGAVTEAVRTLVLRVM